jgi:general secretion pathway protein G
MAQNILLGKKRGFTLVELSIVMAIIGILAMIVIPNGLSYTKRAREATLKQQLVTFRDVIDKFYSDNKRFPDSLEELVDKKYIRMVPIDPFTNSNETWETESSEAGIENIYNVHSGSSERGIDETPVSEW